MEKPEFELVGYVCPLGRYSSPATPIVINPHDNDDNDKYLAVYLNDKLKMSTVAIHVTSEFVELSSAQKKKFELENFDCREQRLFAVSKNDLRSYQPQKKKLFFGGLLSDANFSREDPFFRISLAEKIEDQNLIREELEAGKQYLQKHDPDLLPFLEKEKSRLREIIEPLRESKPLPENRELIHNKLGESTGRDELKPLEYIETEIQKRIESFDDKRKFYRRKANQVNISTALLSALTTFFIGISQAYNSKLIPVIALATSAGMTVLNAWDGLYNYRRRWVQNNDTLMKFYELNSNIKYAKACTGNNLSLETVNKFHERYQDILRSANESWKEDRLTESKKN